MAESYAGIGGHTGHFHLILGVCSAVGGGIVDNRDKSTGIFNVGHITHREGACRGSAGTVPETDLQGVGGGIHLGQYNLVVLRAGADIRAENITSAVRIGRIVVADKGITAARSRLRHISPAVDLENTALIAVEVLAEGYGLLAAGGAEADGGRPVAVALGAAVGAHAHLVGGVGRKARQGVGVGGGVDHSPFGTAADAVVDLPCIVGAVAVGPTDHGGGGGDALRGHGQGRGHHAARQGGEAHHGALVALHGAVAHALHLNLILRLRLKACEGHRRRGGGHLLPCSGGHIQADGHIVDVQIVVGIACRRLAVEGYSYCLARIGGEVYVHALTCGGAYYIVVHIIGATVVPLAQDGPGGLVVGGHQHHEPVIGAGGGRSPNVTAVGRQGQVKVQGAAGRHGHLRGDQPAVFRRSIYIDSCVVVEHSVIGAERPVGARRQRRASHDAAQQAVLVLPAGGQRGAEALVDTVEVSLGAVVDLKAVVGGVARPGHVGGVGRDVGDAPGGEHRRGAVGQGGEGHLHVVDALVVSGAVGHYGERVLGVGGEAGDVEAGGAGCGGAQLGAAVHDGVGLAGGVARVARPADGGAVDGQVRGLGGRGLEAGGLLLNL